MYHSSQLSTHWLARANWPCSSLFLGMHPMPQMPFGCTLAAPLLPDSTQLRADQLVDWACTLDLGSKMEELLPFDSAKSVCNLCWNGRWQACTHILCSWRGRWVRVPGSCQSHSPGPWSHITASDTTCSCRSGGSQLVTVRLVFGEVLLFASDLCYTGCLMKHMSACFQQHVLQPQHIFHSYKVCIFFSSFKIKP